MSDLPVETPPQISAEAVEAAARALMETRLPSGGYAQVNSVQADVLARAALAAALPHLAQPALRHVAAQPDSGPHKPAMPEQYVDDATGKRYVLRVYA